MTAFYVLASSHVVKNETVYVAQIVPILITSPSGLECPKGFNDIAHRVKLRIVACFENALWLVDFYGGISFYTPLELPFDKLLVEDPSFSFDESQNKCVDAP